MENKSIYDKIFDGTCEVCGKTMKKDIYKQGECPHCDWRNCYMNEENPDRVLYPNLVFLNKARKLYAENKPIEPNLEEFLEALHAYSETQFAYNGIYYAVELIGAENESDKIQFFNSQTKESTLFNDDEDFKNNAKVGGKSLKEIWDKITDRYWLQ